MLKRIGAIILLTVCAALLARGLRSERHTVYPLGEGEPRMIGGSEFVEGATSDSYMLDNEKLYDVRSLSKTPVQQKDCKT